MLHTERHLRDATHDFDRECVRLDLLFSLFDRILRMSVVFFQRVSQFVREQKDNCIPEIPVCAICDCAFFARVIGDTEGAKNRGKWGSGRERCLAQEHADIIPYGGSIVFVSIEPRVRYAKIRKESQRKRRQVDRPFFIGVE